MNSDPKSFQKTHFAEEAGLLFEEMGLPRMAGRIVGWLLVCGSDRQSAAQLAEALHASKGSVSTTTRLLSRLSLIERVALPGERSDRFRIRPSGWSLLMRERLAVVSEFRRLAERGLELVSDADQRRQLEEIRDFYAFFERELPALLNLGNSLGKEARRHE